MDTAQQIPPRHPARRPALLVSYLFALIAAAFAFSLAVTIWRGQMWTCGFYAGGPRLHLLGLIVAPLGWYFFRHGIDNTRADWLSFAGKLTLLALSSLLAVAIAEIGLRACLARLHRNESIDELRQLRAKGRKLPVVSTHPLAAIIQPSDDPRLVYELQPGLDFQFDRVRVRTNKSGMRSDHDYPVARPPRSVRIAGLGDSGMFGWDVEQNRDYLSVLESNLRKRNDGVTYEALNFAVPGYNTQLEVQMLRDKALAYHPDIVIVGWCENDFSLPFFMLEKQNYWRRDVSYLYCLLFNRTEFRVLAPAFAMRDQREFSPDEVIPEITSGTDVEGVRTALRDLKALGEKDGFYVLVFGPMKDLIIRICREVGVPYCCTYEKIPADKYPANYLIWFMHPTANGHRVLAEYLERELDERGWLRPGHDVN